MNVMNGCDKFRCDFLEENLKCCIWEESCHKYKCKQYRDCSYCRNSCGGKNKSLLLKIVEMTQSKK